MREYKIVVMEFDYMGEMVHTCVMIEDGKQTVLGTDGGEPEDNSLVRDYSWVVGALNDAYEKGREDGHETGFNSGYELGYDNARYEPHDW